MTINQAIRSILDERGIKQKFLSEKTGIDLNAVCRIMKGQRAIKADEFLKICEVLELDPRMFAVNQQTA